MELPTCGTCGQRLPDYPTQMAKLIGEKCQADRLTLQQAAKQMEISPATVTRLMRGKSPDMNTLRAVRQWLGVPYEAILD